MKDIDRIDKKITELEFKLEMTINLLLQLSRYVERPLSSPLFTIKPDGVDKKTKKIVEEWKKRQKKKEE